MSSKPLQDWRGLPVRRYHPRFQPKHGQCVYWIEAPGEQQTARETLKRLKTFLATDGVEATQALVLRPKANPQKVVDLLVQHRDRLPNLRAIIVKGTLGMDGTYSPVPLLDAFPSLEECSLEGEFNFDDSCVRHPFLSNLSLHSSTAFDMTALNRHLVLPKLELLDLGCPEFKPHRAIDDIWDEHGLTKVILTYPWPFQTPRLRLSRFMDGAYLAKLAANSPVVGHLKELELFGCWLTDESANYLLESPAIPKLQRLTISYHRFSPDMVKRLKALPMKVELRGRIEGSHHNPQLIDD